MKQAAALAAFVLAASSASRASAASDSEWATGVAGSVQFAPSASRGGFWDVQAEYGLNETFHAGVEVGVRHALAGLELEALRATPLLGVRFDVVQWVPYVASGPSLVLSLGSSSRVDFGADVVAGVDYLWSRSWAVGAQYHLTAMTGQEGELLHRAGLRLMYHWGW
jgi:hypothetical protein